MQKRCAIIGGGLSGLSAAVYLAKAGVHVELFEASPKLGGRAYSFHEAQTGCVIDNGQHIMMGCYRETLRFLETIGAMDKISVQKKLKVTFVDRTSGLVEFKSGIGPYPISLILGILNYKALKFSERLQVLRFFSKLLFLNPSRLKDITVLGWLEKEKQSKRAIKAFYEILSVGVLNTDPGRAAASMFASVLRKMFFKGSKAASIIIPRTGLSQMYCEDSERLICELGGNIRISEPVRGVGVKDNKILGLTLESGEFDDFDAVISAVPHHSFSKIFPENIANPGEISYSSILSLNIFMKENPFSEEFYGLIDSPVQWVFNHEKYITIVISNADGLIDKPKDELQEMILKELKEFFPQFKRDMVSGMKMIKEKRATFVPDARYLECRPIVESGLDNLFLSGDWIETGLPATIEGAVLSGRNAAMKALHYLKNA